MTIPLARFTAVLAWPLPLLLVLGLPFTVSCSGDEPSALSHGQSRSGSAGRSPGAAGVTSSPAGGGIAGGVNGSTLSAGAGAGPAQGFGAGTGGLPVSAKAGTAGYGGTLALGGATTGSGGNRAQVGGTAGVAGGTAIAGVAGRAGHSAGGGGTAGAVGVGGSGGGLGGKAGQGGAGAGGIGGLAGFSPCPATGDCRLLPLGDSITFGSTSNNGGYRVELFSRAHQDNRHLTFLGSQANGPATVAGVAFPRSNEGHPGWTIQQISDIATVTNGLKGTPNIVLLHIGTNDMQTTPTGASDRLGALIDKITAALPDALLLVSSIIPIPWRETYAVAYNATIPGIVKTKSDAGKHVIYVEMHQGFPSNGLGTDNIHPSDTVGYPWMGDTWYTAIKTYLR